MSRYLRILRRRAALLPFLAAVVARMPISMGPLGMVLLVQSVRGEYAVAGVVTAAWAVASSVATPVLGRGLDRFGQPVLIGVTSVTSGALLATFAVLAAGGAPDGVLLALSAGVGLTFPPMGPAMRMAWRVVLTAEEDRRAAYALDAVAVETIFVGGPLLLSALLVVAPPAVPLVVTGALLAGGGAGYALTPAARRARSVAGDGRGGRRGVSPLRVPGVLAVFAVTAGLSVGFGLTDLSIAATAREALGSQARVGILFAAIAGGSATGGLWYGARAWHGPERLRYPVTLSGFAAGLVALSLLLRAAGAPSLLVILPLMFLAGSCIAPSLIIAMSLVDRLAPRDRLGEAQSWLNTGFTAGAAGGTALGGLLVDAGGPAASFLGAGTAVGAAAALAVVAQPSWRAADPSPVAEPGPPGEPSRPEPTAA